MSIKGDSITATLAQPRDYPAEDDKSEAAMSEGYVLERARRSVETD